jgi:hypothetical protein
VPDCEPAAFTTDSVPRRLADIGDPAAGIDDAIGSLTALLELAERQRADGLPDAPDGTDPDGQSATTSRSDTRTSHGPATKTSRSDTRTPPGPTAASGPTGRRRSVMPLIEVARAASKDEAMAGLDRWRSRHPEVYSYLEPPDILVDAMRGRSSAWYRIRLNLRHVPLAERPEQEPLEVDYDPWAGLTPPPRSDDAS